MRFLQEHDLMNDSSKDADNDGEKMLHFCSHIGMGPIVGLLTIPTTAEPEPDEPYEAYFLYLGDHPSEANPGWHQEVQGIRHDNGYWYITQESKLWKIPVTHDLSHSASSNPSVRTVTMG